LHKRSKNAIYPVTVRWFKRGSDCVRLIQFEKQKKHTSGFVSSEGFMIDRSVRISYAGRASGKQIAFVLALLALAGTAHAATGGGGLPWENPLNTLVNSVSGPVATGASILGIVGAGAILIFAGGHVNEFVRAVLFLVLVIGLVISAKNTLTALGFAAGAEVSPAIVQEGIHGAAPSHTP
jgi:type IV secretion system protein TrbC